MEVVSARRQEEQVSEERVHERQEGRRERDGGGEGEETMRKKWVRWMERESEID